MARNLKMFGILFLALVSLSIANADWSIFGGDVNRTFEVNGVGTINKIGLTKIYGLGDSVSSTPIVVDGILYIGTNNYSGSSFYAINLSDNSLLFKFDVDNAIFSSPVYYDGVIYFGCDNGKLYSINSTDGSLIWNFTINGSFPMIDSSPIIYDNKVLFGASGNPDFYALDLNGNVVWNFTTRNYTWGYSVFSSPAIANDKIIFGSYDGYVYALNLDGSLVWNYSIGKYVEGTPTVFDNKIVIGAADGVYAFDFDGNLLWNFSAGQVRGGITISDLNGDGSKEVIFGSYDNNLYVLNESGAKICSFTANDDIFMAPLVADIDADGGKEIFFGDKSDKVYILNSNCGLIDSKSIGGIVSSPLFVNIDSDGNREILIVSSGGDIYVVNGVSEQIPIKVIVHMQNETIFKRGVVNRYDDGKTILEKLGFNVSGDFDSNWGFMLKCIQSVCSPSDWSWWWQFDLMKQGEAAWNNMPVGIGPGGSQNNFCWNRNYSSSGGHYCAYSGDVVYLKNSSITDVDILPEFEISNIYHPSRVRDGNTFEVVIEVNNYGVSNGDVNVSIYMNGRKVDEKSVSLDVDEGKNISFTLEAKKGANYEVNLTSDGEYNLSNNHESFSPYIYESEGSSGGTSTGSSRDEVIQDEFVNTIFNPGMHVRINVTHEDIDVKQIEIMLNGNVEKLTVKIKKIELPTQQLDVKVYKYFECEVEDVNTSLVAGANITFEVNKSWLDENGINYTTIRLFRYHNGWQELNTTMNHFENGVYYFTAFTPGFSEFAIGVTNKVSDNASVGSSNSSQASIINSSFTESGSTKIVERGEFNWQTFAIVIWILVLFALVFVLFVMPRIRR